jgi:hypothetical protein
MAPYSLVVNRSFRNFYCISTMMDVVCSLKRRYTSTRLHVVMLLMDFIFDFVRT